MLNIRNKTILWLLVLVFGASLIIWSSYSWNRHASVIQDQLPAVSSTISTTSAPTPLSGNLGKPSGKNLQSLTPQEVEKMLNNGGNFVVPTAVPYDQLSESPSCQTVGTIKFLSPALSENIGAKLIYSGIDSPARQIKWKISPSDSLLIGPNLMASLKLPDGDNPVGVSLPANPQSKNYKLVASITYGRLVDEGERVYEMNCSGEVEVILAY